MTRLKVWCDECGELINENEENSCVIYKTTFDDTLIFCDSDCLESFIKEYTKDSYIDYHGRLVED